MNRTILLSGRTVAYTLTWKRVKNVNLRVHADGSVTVSAPRSVSLGEIETMLRQRASFLLGALDRFAELEERAPRNPAYEDGDTMFLLGRPLRIAVERGNRNRAEQRGDALIVTVRAPEDRETREKAVHAFLRDQCLTVTAALCRDIQERLSPLGVPLPEIRVRSMTSRWGSCKPSAARVTFARQLIEAPLPCVEYVVWHEMIHFLHPDHSPAFYSDLAAFLPDWKERKILLNSHRYRSGNRSVPE